MSVLNQKISYYPSIQETKKGRPVSLLTILQSDKHETIIATLRNETDPLKQKSIKESLACFTVAGIFNGRNNQGIISLSGLAAVDLDSVEGYDPLQVLNELKKIPFIAYCGLSCRGKRLFAIVPFMYPELHERHYAQLVRSFEAIGLPMGDNCHKIISQPRFVSSNTEQTQFSNHQAKKYPLLQHEKKYYLPERLKVIRNNRIPENSFQWCVDQINKRLSFAENKRHSYILQLARYCNLKGIDENDTLIGCFEFISGDFKEYEIKSIVKHVYLKHKDSFNKYPFTD